MSTGNQNNNIFREYVINTEETNKNEDIPTAIIVDPASGFIFDSLREGDSYRVITREQQEYLRTNTPWKFEAFHMVNNDELQLLMKELDVQEKAFMASITPYLGYSMCFIQYSNGNHIALEDVIELTGMSRGTFYKVLKSLCNKRVICKYKIGDTTSLIVNPWLYFRGNHIDTSLKEIFKDYCIRSKGGVKWRCLQ